MGAPGAHVLLDRGDGQVPTFKATIDGFAADETSLSAGDPLPSTLEKIAAVPWAWSASWLHFGYCQCTKIGSAAYS
jgi:hypothetical protein